MRMSRPWRKMRNKVESEKQWFSQNFSHYNLLSMYVTTVFEHKSRPLDFLGYLFFFPNEAEQKIPSRPLSGMVVSYGNPWNSHGFPMNVPSEKVTKCQQEIQGVFVPSTFHGGFPWSFDISSYVSWRFSHQEHGKIRFGDSSFAIQELITIICGFFSP